MWRAQIARFQDPYLRIMVEHAWVLKSGECCTFLLNYFWHMSTRNDWKEMCNIPQIWVLTHANLNSLSRGSWNRAICARHMVHDTIRTFRKTHSCVRLCDFLTYVWYADCSSYVEIVRLLFPPAHQKHLPERILPDYPRQRVMTRLVSSWPPRYLRPVNLLQKIA